MSESEKTTVIGYVAKGGPADEAGLRPGDRILEVDGKPVSKFSGMGDSVMWRIVRSEGEIVPVRDDGVLGQPPLHPEVIQVFLDKVVTVALRRVRRAQRYPRHLSLCRYLGVRRAQRSVSSIVSRRIHSDARRWPR